MMRMTPVVGTIDLPVTSATPVAAEASVDLQTSVDEMTGLQADHPDGTATVPIPGSYTRDGLAA